MHLSNLLLVTFKYDQLYSLLQNIKGTLFPVQACGYIGILIYVSLDIAISVSLSVEGDIYGAKTASWSKTPWILTTVLGKCSSCLEH